MERSKAGGVPLSEARVYYICLSILAVIYIRSVSVAGSSGTGCRRSSNILIRNFLFFMWPKVINIVFIV